MRTQFRTLITLSVSICWIVMGCSRQDTSPRHSSTSASSSHSADSTSSTLSVPTTTLFYPYVPPLNCDISKVEPPVNPSELNGGCVGNWLTTQYSGCVDCDWVSVWTAVDGKWKFVDYMYTMCWDSDRWYGQSPENDVLTSLQLVFVTWKCDDDRSEFPYHPEPASGPLKFGDTGNRVRALQTALFARGYFDDYCCDVVVGEFGSETVRAVLNFQYSARLTVNGIAGRETHTNLGLQY